MSSAARQDRPVRVVPLAGGSESQTQLVVDVGSRRKFVRKEAHQHAALVDWPGDHPYSKGLVWRLRRQVSFLQSLPPGAIQLFPQVLAVDDNRPKSLSVDLEYIDGPTVSQLARSEPARWGPAVELAREVLQTRVHCHWRTPAAGWHLFQHWHVSKMTSRFGLARSAVLAHHLEQRRQIVVNGRQLSPLRVVLDQLSTHEAMLSPAWLSMVVGDTNTHNILVEDQNAQQIRFLDPRGVGVLIDGHVVDDPLYDWKFWHNSLGHYDALFEGRFELTGAADGEVLLRHSDPLGVRTWRAAHQLFGRDPLVTGDFDPIFLGQHVFQRFLFLMGSHFVAMMPFHLNRHNQEGRCAADLMYLEALFWLNLCLNSIRSDFDPTELTDFWLPEERT